MDDAMQSNGWTAIPNDLLDNLGDLGNAELRVLLALVRKTAGYQKESDRVSVSQLVTMTGLTSRNAQSALTSLLASGHIGREQAGKQTFTYHVKPYPVGTRIIAYENHIPSDTRSLGDTVPYPVGTRIEAKPYPVGTTQKKDLKKEESEDASAAVAASPAPAEKTKRERKPRPTDPNQAHPAVVVFYEKTARRPNKEQAHLIASRITDTDRWLGTITFWLQRGWSAMNIGGMVSRYERLDDRPTPNRPPPAVAGSLNGTNGAAHEPYDYDSQPSPYELRRLERAARSAAGGGK